MRLETPKGGQIRLALLLLNLLVKFAQAKQQQQVADNSQQQQASNNKSKQNERLNLIEADQNGLYLLGLFDIHQSNPRIPFKCGQIDVDAGEWQSRRPMQNMEAFLWAIEQVNADKSLLPGIRLGSLVMDTCSSFLRTNQQMANLLHGQLISRGQQIPAVRQIAAVVADNADWHSVEAVVSMASAVGLTTFVTQSRSSKLTDFARKYKTGNQLDPASIEAPSAPNPKSVSVELADDLQRRSSEIQFEGLLGDLLGVGKMIGAQAEGLNSSSGEQDQQQKLYMIRMLLGNELLADAIASLVQRMNWDLISLIYDDELDMVDLHDELVRQLFSRNIQLALDEQVSPSSSSDIYDRLLQTLAKKTALGSRVVITLLGTGSARLLLDSLSHLRNLPATNIEQVRQVNSLLWITVTDREPYYSFATDALGTIAISSSASLMAEFKSYYERLANEQHGAINKWWPEYMRAIMVKQQKDVELISNECTKWLEPKVSPINERCRSLNLASLVQAEKAAIASSNKSSSGNGNKLQWANGTGKLSKYLAGGWEHNGMDVINSVLAAANGLESIRQALCPESQAGMCARMRELVFPSSSARDNRDLLPTVSELMYNEMLRSTFQLADGRMFNLDDFNSHGGQLEANVKLYNLRYLRPSSIGFVKFGSFDQQDGLELNVSKALHYYSAGAANNSYQDQVPIESVRSSCQDESKCLMVSSYEMMNKQAISEEELAIGVNSLFKLDHPLILSQAHQQLESATGASNGKQQQTINLQVVEDSHIHTMRSSPAIGHFAWPSSPPPPPQQTNAKANGKLEQQHSISSSNSSAKRTFNTIVLLPLHKGYQSSRSAGRCGQQMDIEHSFQHLLAFAYAQSIANQMTTVHSNSNGLPVASVAAEGEQIELTTTVIDYCEQVELAKLKLAAKLAESSSAHDDDLLGAGGANVKRIAVIDFDSKLSEQIDNLVESYNLLHLTIASSSSSSERIQSSQQHQKTHLRLNLLPSKSNEIQAIIKLISSMSQWKLVHLIYTDHHHYRDEFVRRANKANICVSKLIWIPSIGRASSQDELATTNNETLREQRLIQTEKTKHLFANELHDYSADQSTASARDTTTTDGLNETRVIVLLASADDSTNQMILEAASKTMLEDYVWITSHEWLRSVELPAEMAEANGRGTAQVILPRFFLSTRLETIDSNQYRHYLSNLTPALHAPTPTVWFDQFWQQHFQCRLPISTQSAADRSNLPVCKSNQRLEPHQIIEDDHVQYTISAMHSIHAAIQAQNLTKGKDFDAAEFAQSFRQAYGLLAFNSHLKRPVARLSYGFHIVHRVLPSTAYDIQRRLSKSSNRRENGRDLANSLIQGQLLRVGLWRDGELILNNRRTSNDSSNHLFWLNPTIPRDTDQDTPAKITDSLAKLGSIKSRCLTSQVCSLCRQQVEQTNALIKQEEARFKQSESSSEPKAISSIWTLVDKEQDSMLDSPPSATFDDGEEQDSSEITSDSKSTSKRNNPEDIHASASSLFDEATQKQLEQQQRESDMKRSFSQMMHLRAQWAQPPSLTSNLRQVSGALMSILSLFGIVCVIASMSYYYPNMLERRQKSASALLTSQSSSTIASYTGELTVSTKDRLPIQLDTKLSSLDNINDYFLLTGLLMLYSINIAFLLPATLSVCWFRRIGLATSYTVIFSSILVKVLANYRQSSRQKLHHQSNPSQQQQVALQGSEQQQQQLRYQADPVEESVEVTFESLPPDQGNSNTIEPQLEQNCATIDQITNGYQTNSHAIKSSGEQKRAHPAMLNLATCSPFNLLTSLISLILSQLLVSFLWLLQQPPEPTLYFACWRCSSPSRSPILFFYEPLLALVYPALILTATWMLSIKAFRLASQNEESNRVAVQRQLVLNSSPDQTNTNWQLKNCKQIQLASKLRDAKSLVMTTTLLILIGSILTLKMISSSQKLMPTLVLQQQPVYSVSQNDLSARTDDLTLVYANLVSGAIIFIFLFIYRLHLFNLGLSWPLTNTNRSARSKSRGFVSFSSNSTNNNSFDTTSSQRRQVLKFNQETNQQVASNKWLDEDTYPRADFGSSLFTGSQFSTSGSSNSSRQERLKLQQFNTYGTYSAASSADSSIENYHTSTTVNPLSLQTKRRNRASPNLFFSSSLANGSKRSAGKTNSLSGGGAESSKLQRRQSSGSVASSTAKLMSRSDSNSIMDSDDMFMDDTISCASSVASSSTSQLHGNDLYPIDCSIQLDLQLPSDIETNNSSSTSSNMTTFQRSASFNRRLSLRSINKLTSVKEEQNN